MGQEWYISEDLEGSGRSQSQDMTQNLAGENEQNHGNSNHGWEREKPAKEDR
jgi:hypothetical protein